MEWNHPFKDRPPLITKDGDTAAWLHGEMLASSSVPQSSLSVPQASFSPIVLVLSERPEVDTG